MRHTLFVFVALLTTAAVLRAVPLRAQTATMLVPLSGDTSIFAPLTQTMVPAPSAVRLATGAPGPKYWQNRADYNLKGTLDTATHTLHGSMTLRYTNNSPDVLKTIWLQTEQRTEAIDRLDQLVGAKSIPLTYHHPGNDVFETQVTLAEPLKPRQTATFQAEWHFTVPDAGYRMGREGALYEMAQWYPRPNVYDDVKGWNTESYATNAEFYLEYGDYTVEITVPAGYIVAATGILDNPGDVLTPSERARLEQAARSDTIVHIVTAGELQSGAARATTTGMLTWKFHAKNVRDAAWATSPDYQWDATAWRNILVQSYYRPASATAWVDAADQARMSIQEYSERWYPYPYPQVTVVEGPVGGMEYPMLAMESGNDGSKPGLYSVLTHEVGHDWFPMIVGSNERMHAWMDEGFNTFINTFSEARRYPGNGDQASRISHGTFAGNGAVLETGNPTPNTDGAQYHKTAHVLQLLRVDVLGPELFDKAFQVYIRRWAFKHPTPADFFRTIEDVSGRKLDWFWREAFLEAPRFDQAVDSIAQTTQGAETHVTVTYGNHARFVLPLSVRFTFSDGTTQNVTYPVDIWRTSNAYTASYTFSGKTVKSIVLDADQHLPDADRTNNSWTAPER